MTVALIALALYALASTAGTIVLWRANQTAHDRLYLAWREGAIIPAPEDAQAVREPPPEVDVMTEAREYLPEALVNFVGQWEGDEAKRKWLSVAKAMLKKHKGDQAAAYLELTQPTGF